MPWTTIVSPKELAEHLSDSNLVLIDCRFALGDVGAGRREYEAGHLPGACYAHLDDDLSSPITAESGRHPLPNPATLGEKLAGWGVGGESQIVAYDNSGGAFAARFWWLVRWLGHQNVAVLNGGYDGWTLSGLPTTTEVPTPTRGDFTPSPDDSLWLTSEAVASAMDSGSVLLIDARERERYLGETEPIDPVAGHVPGAINIPFKQNLSPSGEFLPVDLLAERFSSAVADESDAEVVHMCGSGVTACHNLLAMEIAGLPGGKLYAGSWSEWIRNSARPVATD